MKIELNSSILEDIAKNMNDSGFCSNGFGYTIKINDEEIGLLKIDYNKKVLEYTAINFDYDGIMRRTIFGNAWMKYLDT